MVAELPGSIASRTDGRKASLRLPGPSLSLSPFVDPALARGRVAESVKGRRRRTCLGSNWLAWPLRVRRCNAAVEAAGLPRQGGVSADEGSRGTSFDQRVRQSRSSSACNAGRRRAYVAARFPRGRRGREAEGGGLLNRYRVVKLYPGFESLRLRQLSRSPASASWAKHV